MRFSLRLNEKGMTLVELIVTLGVSATLLIFIVSGSLFVQNYVSSEQRANKLFEELSAISRELRDGIENSRQVSIFSDSLVCQSLLRERTTYSWTHGAFMRNGKHLLGKGFTLDNLSVEKLDLPKYGDSSIYHSVVRQYSPGLYGVRITVSDRKGNRDSLSLTAGNDYEKTKYKP